MTAQEYPTYAELNAAFNGVVAQKLEVEAALDREHGFVKRHEARIAELEAGNRRLLPVVEAAKALRRELERVGWEEVHVSVAAGFVLAVDALGTDAADGAGTGEHPAWLIDLVNAAVLAQEAEDECDWTPQGNCTEECAWCGWERLLEALPADVREAARQHLNRVPAASPAGSSTADEGDGRG